MTEEAEFVLHSAPSARCCAATLRFVPCMPLQVSAHIRKGQSVFEPAKLPISDPPRMFVSVREQ